MYINMFIFKLLGQRARSQEEHASHGGGVLQQAQNPAVSYRRRSRSGHTQQRGQGRFRRGRRERPLRVSLDSVAIVREDGHLPKASRDDIESNRFGFGAKFRRQEPNQMKQENRIEIQNNNKKQQSSFSFFFFFIFCMCAKLPTNYSPLFFIYFFDYLLNFLLFSILKQFLFIKFFF